MFIFMIFYIKTLYGIYVLCINNVYDITSLLSEHWCHLVIKLMNCIRCDVQ